MTTHAHLEPKGPAMSTRMRARALPLALLACLGVAWASSGCTVPEYGGVQIVHVVPFPTRCTGEMDAERVKLTPASYDLLSWELGQTPYYMPLRLENFMFSSANPLLGLGEGNWRRLLEAEIEWVPPAGWREQYADLVDALPRVRIPLGQVMQPLENRVEMLSIMDDALWRALDVLYAQPNCSNLQDPSFDVCPNLPTIFEVRVRIAVEGPDGTRRNTNVFRYPVQVCKGCFYTPPGDTSECCVSPYKLTNSAGATAYADIVANWEKANICAPFQDMALGSRYRSLLPGGYSSLNCNLCYCNATDLSEMLCLLDPSSRPLLRPCMPVAGVTVPGPNDPGPCDPPAR